MEYYIFVLGFFHVFAIVFVSNSCLSIDQEWMEELQILLRELTGRSGKVRTQQPDQNSDSIVAWSKIRAVYGKFSNSVTLEQLSLQKTVTRWLGKTKHIIHTSVSASLWCISG